MPILSADHHVPWIFTQGLIPATVAIEPFNIYRFMAVECRADAKGPNTEANARN